MTWQIIQSGLEYKGLNPINVTSSSDILLKFFKTISGVTLIIIGSESLPSFFHSAKIVARPSFLILLGCKVPQPSSLSSPQRFTLPHKANTYFHLASPCSFKACLYLSLLTKSLLHLKQTHFIHF